MMCRTSASCSRPSSRPFFFGFSSSTTTVLTSDFTDPGRCRTRAARVLPMRYSASGSRRLGNARVTTTVVVVTSPSAL